MVLPIPVDNPARAVSSIAKDRFAGSIIRFFITYFSSFFKDGFHGETRHVNGML